MDKIPSQSFFANIAGVEKSSLSNNIRILLRMVLKNGGTMNKNIAEKMNREFLKSLKYSRFSS